MYRNSKELLFARLLGGKLCTEAHHLTRIHQHEKLIKDMSTLKKIYIRLSSFYLMKSSPDNSCCEARNA